ncbi:MAG: hypothetical protein GC161_19435 [Planctomycetaceae bacterium]|nr:hypothetical protein [Planctomycetaceae bacterium]
MNAERAPVGLEGGDRRTALWLAALGFLFAALLSNGLRSSNDGSSFALTKALAETGSARIDPYAAYTGRVDFAMVEGRFYSERPPWLSFAAVPGFWIAAALADAVDAPRLGDEYETAHGIEGARATFPIDDAAIRGALGIVHASYGALLAVAYLLCRRLGAGAAAALYAAVVLGLATLFHKYGASFFTQMPAATAVTGAALVALNAPRRLRRSAGLGLLLGFLPGLDYGAAIPAAVLVGVMFLAAGPKNRAWWRSVGALVVGAVPGALLFGLYNWTHFGGPFSIPYGANAGFEWARSFGSMFSGEPTEALWGFFFDLSRQGLVAATPVLAVGALGIVPMVRRAPAASAAFALAVLVLTVLMAHHRAWWGGGTNDPRYLMPVLPLLVVPLALAIDRCVAARAPGAVRSGLWIALVLVAAWSAVAQHFVARAFLLDPWWGHELMLGPTHLLTTAASGRFLRLLPLLVQVGVLGLLGAALLLPLRVRCARRPALWCGLLALTAVGLVGCWLAPGAFPTPRG